MKRTRMTHTELAVAKFRMTAIQVAAGLPEPTCGGSGGTDSWGHHGKSADKVVADAEKLMAFVLK